MSFDVPAGRLLSHCSSLGVNARYGSKAQGRWDELGWRDQLLEMPVCRQSWWFHLPWIVFACVHPLFPLLLGTSWTDLSITVCSPVLAKLQ